MFINEKGGAFSRGYKQAVLDFYIEFLPIIVKENTEMNDLLNSFDDMRRILSKENAFKRERENENNIN